MPIKAMDLYPYKCEPVRFPEPAGYPRAIDLKINAASGIYDVVSLYNWEEEKKDKVIDFQEDLGLEDLSEYLVFDYWNTKFLGISKDKIIEEVPPHGTKALIIRKKKNHPQLMATSRHLTGAYSIKKMHWDSGQNVLSGTSMAVAGKQYILFIHIPNGYVFDRTMFEAKNIAYAMHPSGMLEVSFTGEEMPVNWKISFRKSE